MTAQPKDRGAAAVEFALVVPLLVLLVLGIAEFGHAYHVQSTLTGAARDAAREVALSGDRAEAEAAAVRSAAGHDLAAITFVDATTGSTIGGCSPGVHVRAEVVAETSFLTHMFGQDLTLTGKATMRCGG